jgi:osmotically-inducible protein OsmY
MSRPQKNQANGRAGSCEANLADLASLVVARLRGSGYPHLGSVTCQISDGVAVLSGTVPSFHLKQLAQALAAQTEGVRQIDNRLHVKDLAGRGSANGRFNPARRPG